MRAALAGWIACAGGAAPGRDIPVYREYTLPISFYDEQGERAVSAALAPDRVENQSVCVCVWGFLPAASSTTSLKWCLASQKRNRKKTR